MVNGSRPLAAPDNLMDGAPEERNSSRRGWGLEVEGREKQQKNKRRGEKKEQECGGKKEAKCNQVNSGGQVSKTKGKNTQQGEKTGVK